MKPYDPTLAPVGFGLHNTGAICYLNSFLQALASCTAFTDAVLDNEEYLRQTGTGTAMLSFVRAFTGAGLDNDLAFHSAKILSAVVADLKARRPWVRFGGGQESASEALAHILDMMEPAGQPFERKDGAALGVSSEDARPTAAVYSIESPITRLFLHRFRCDLHCRSCQKLVSSTTDHMVVFNLFHIDRVKPPPTTPEAFSKALLRHIVKTEDYVCESCKQKVAAFRVYSLTMIPEILFCTFNLYEGFGGGHYTRYFPSEVRFPAVDGGTLVFRLVSQVEHSGSLSGGHYWAHALRAGDRVLCLNDLGGGPSTFAPRPNTYIIAYHFTDHFTEHSGPTASLPPTQSAQSAQSAQ
jgi:ubiquitin C-terminal hydrolase